MRRFEFHDDKSQKYWEIDQEGTTYTVHYGRIGTDGQTKTKSSDTEEKAAQEVEKLIASKVKKGYQEVGGGGPVKKATTTAKPKAESKKAGSKKAPEAPTATVTAAAPKVDPNPEADLGLTLADQHFATWRKLRRIAPTEPRPFELEQCLSELDQLIFVQTDYWKLPDWSRFTLPEAMSREEAHFWFEALTPKDRGAKVKAMKATLAKGKYTGKLSLSDIKKRILKSNLHPRCLVPLYFLLPLEELLEVALLENTRYASTNGIAELAAGFHEVVPYLSEDQLGTVREKLRPDITIVNWPDSLYHVPSAFIVAGAVGMGKELLPIIESWNDKKYTGDEWTDHYHAPQRIIFGLGTAELVSLQMRRLKLRLRYPDYIKGWIAHTGVNELDHIVWSISGENNKNTAEWLLSTFAETVHPAVAEPMIELSTGCKAGKAAKTWLQENLVFAVEGLGAALTESNPPAVEWLRIQKRLGHEQILRDYVKGAPKEAARRIQEQVLDYADPAENPFSEKTTPAWLNKAVADLTEAFPKVAKGKAVDWIVPQELPPVIVKDACLNEDQIVLLFKALKATAVGDANPLIAAVKANADSKSLEQFAWKLFEAWLAEGTPSKEKWALLAMGHLGGDECALKLTPLIRQWPGESQHQRAVTGLEVLRGIGTETALMQLNGISQKVKFKGIKTRAMEVMNLIAKERGISKAELEDLLVPDCGLDEKGRRVFDFGPRSFTFLLGSDLKPKVRDEKGKVKDNLPKPGAKDDATLANEAVSEWKLIKKQIRETAKIQALRLENAMVVGRRWPVDKFELLLARHPLMTHICRPLLFGGFDKKGKLKGTFRVTEEQDYADSSDEPTTIDGYDSIGVVHPLLLGDKDRQTWGELLSDYELIPPFEQLGRPVLTLTAKEKTEKDLKRFHKLSWPSPTLVFGLEKMGWIRGEPMDGGGFDEHSKQFPAAGVTAVVFYEGCVAMGYIDPDEKLTLTGAIFVKGMREPSGYGWGHKKDEVLPLGKVDPIVISEVLRDLEVLEAKAK